MRYYELSLFQAGAATPQYLWTSYPNGNYDPGALNIEFDIPVTPSDTPTGGQTITLQGISLADLNEAQQFTNMQLVLKGGMKAGLPLVNPNQSGVITMATVFQSFGNWEGTEMTLDFVIYPSPYSFSNPGNIVLNWPAGTELSTALIQTFKTAYPTFKVAMNIDSSHVQSSPETIYAASFEELGQKIIEITDGSLNPVSMAIQGGQIQVWDDSYKPNPILIDFTDLIGQPVWINTNVIQAKFVMRADLVVGSMIRFPPGFQNAPGMVTTTAQSYPSNLKYKTAFQGNFQIIALRHIGNFRSSDGASWATIADCAVTGG